ncbi:MAG: hypothetical protein EXR70_07390 [Deltaproteobacteria bacterium]|nr:hypothetical protein [Deltaproteobacteria bacterium]
MRFFFKLIFLLIFLTPVALAFALYLAVDGHPTIERAASVTPASVERAKRILDNNDPRKLKSGETRTVATSAADLDLAANYLAQQFAHGSARVELRRANFNAGASLRLPLIPIPLFVNVDAALAENDPSADLESLRIGQLTVPAWLARWVAPRILSWFQPDLDYQAFIDAVKKVSINEARMAVTYQWQANLGDQLRAVLIPRKNQEQLRAYQERLAEVVQSAKKADLPLTDLLVAMLKLAAERSASGDAAVENRAALFILMHYVTAKPLDAILPDAKSWPAPAKHRVVLDTPEEFPRHFITAASLAANAGGAFAQAVGVYKEIEDARAENGIAIKNFAADRAGKRFGAYGASAKKLQEKLGNGLREQDILPATADLPPFLSAEDFKRRFDSVESKEYKKIMADIDRRIAALPLFR